eukprot:2009708-Pleurochrysis_carterae.AAC.1
MSREESRLKRLTSSSVPSMKVLLNFLDSSLKRLKRWFLNLGLSPEFLVLLIAMSARKSRTRAA